MEGIDERRESEVGGAEMGGGREREIPKEMRTKRNGCKLFPNKQEEKRKTVKHPM